MSDYPIDLQVFTLCALQYHLAKCTVIELYVTLLGVAEEHQTDLAARSAKQMDTCLENK